MKYIFTFIVIFFFVSMPLATAQDWKSSPYNWKNSPYNWENSSHNWKNSPHNWNNSPMRWGNERIIRDNGGKPMGYGVPKRDGGVNFFDLKGNRRGYLPEED
jgi:hypothetical protein